MIRRADERLQLDSHHARDTEEDRLTIPYVAGLNVMQGSTWRGAKLKIATAKPKFSIK